MKHSLLFFLILIFLSPLDALAGIGEDLASPVTTPAVVPFVLGSLATIGLLVFEDQVVDPLQSETTEDKPLGKYSKYGDYAGQMIPNAAYALSMLFAGALGDEDGVRRAEVMTLATLYAAGVTTVLKYTVREPRPNDGSDRRSFPSGHATTAFAFASVVAAEHDFIYGFLAYSLAGLVAYSRINDNRHYVHDVVAGATIGISYGLGIYYRRKSSGGFTVLPFTHEGTYGLLLKTEF